MFFIEENFVKNMELKYLPVSFYNVAYGEVLKSQDGLDYVKKYRLPVLSLNERVDFDLVSNLINERLNIPTILNKNNTLVKNHIKGPEHLFRKKSLVYDLEATIHNCSNKVLIVHCKETKVFYQLLPFEIYRVVVVNYLTKLFTQEDYFSYRE